MEFARPIRVLCAASVLVLAPAGASRAQLQDATQIHPHVPGGQIAKSLTDQIGAGRGDGQTPGSSIYLIQRDPARAIRRGRQLFQRKFTLEQGQGPRVSAHSSGDILENRALGAGLSDSCAGCHGRPRGAAGVGGVVQTRPDSRDAAHLFGLGLVEQLADEMTAELRAIRDRALAGSLRQPRRRGGRADRGDRVDGGGTSSGGTSSVPLVAKGISFGTLRVRGGELDTSLVRGVDADLRVRPFFAHGGTMSIREFVVGAMKAEMGIEVWDPDLCAASDPVAPQRVTSPSGFVFDPALDTIERPPVCGISEDGDGDGVVNEFDVALLDHLEFYLLNYFKPGLARQTRRTQRGLSTLRSIGCTGCHTESLTVAADRRVADVETVHDPSRGIFNRLFATASTRFVIVPDGADYPRLDPERKPFVVRNFFSDLKRHDLGPAFYEREYDGGYVEEFVTEPLWGVATTAPYGHDGRSINLEEVILRHGGEAQAARDRFARLGESDRLALLDFLGTLVLFPPDDTASNLNPGNRAGNPQDPASHGNIDLGALFQIDYEGPE